MRSKTKLKHLTGEEKNMRNFKAVIEYNGKKFNGWQKQPDKLNIQGEIEEAIKEITGETVEVYASRKNRRRSA